VKKKSKKSTAKRLLEFEDRWAPDNVSLASIKTSIPTQTMVTVPKLSKKKRSWTRWAIIQGSDLTYVVYDSELAAQDTMGLWQAFNAQLGKREKLAVKKVKVIEV